jgi:hypothetical protein
MIIPLKECLQTFPGKSDDLNFLPAFILSVRDTEKELEQAV